MALDISGLDSHIFSVFAEASKRQYYYLYNMKTRVSRWSRSAVDYFGIPGEYMLDAVNFWGTFLHPDDRDAYYQDIFEVLRRKKPVHSMEYRARNREGDYVLCSCHGKLIPGVNGQPDLFAVSITNHGIIENVDPVTNLYNVYEFLRNAKELCLTKESAAIMLIGLSKFQDINDIYGYTFGNRVLQQMAYALRDLVQNNGTVYRMDGPKFAISCRNANGEQLQILYNKLRDMVKQTITIGDVSVPLSLCGGALVLNGQISNENSIRACMNYALDCSKNERHGELVFFDNSLQKNNVHSLEVLAMIRQSVLNGCTGFYLCYQPLVEPISQRIIGAEALVRWHTEALGEVSPGFFIPLLERDPCFYELGAWILRQATHDMKPIVDRHPDFVVNVNVAHTQLESIGFREVVLNALQENQFPSENLCIELTERCRDMDIRRLQDEIRFFHSHHIRIALDDFGTGSSSLGLLRDLDIDSLKIDRSFIVKAHTHEVDRILLDCVLTCGIQLGMGICLEGVETAENREFLLKYPARYHQGYFYHRPLPLSKFITLFE